MKKKHNIVAEPALCDLTSRMVLQFSYVITDILNNKIDPLTPIKIFVLATLSKLRQ